MNVVLPAGIWYNEVNSYKKTNRKEIIAMKLHTKLLFLLVMFALLLPLGLVSCNPADPGEQTTPETAPEIPPVEMLTIGAGGATEYTIVYPDEVNSFVSKAVYNLRSAIGDAIGKKPDSKSDFVKKGEEIPVGTKEILIGQTNRPESAEGVKNLADNEFVIQVSGDRVVIAAPNDVLLIQAIRYFTDTYVSSAADTIAVPADLNLVRAPEVKDAVVENGDGTVTLHLNHFSVTYDAGNKQAYIPSVADAFAALAADKFGLLGILEDQYANEYEILFGSCKREAYKTTDKKFLFRDFYLHYTAGKLSISAASIYGYEAAIRYIVDKNGVITIPADGLYQEYDYGTGTLAEIRKNYENPNLEGAWMVTISHRGDVTTNNYPENSLPAYQSCIDIGVDVIETDISKTSDGKWVICHDNTVDRTTTGTGKVSSLKYEQLQTFYLKEQNGGDGVPATEYKMPTLVEVIELCKGKVLLNLDKLSSSSYQAIYDVFEKNDAVNLALYKGEMSAKDLTEWFCQLLRKGRELPLYSPLLYSASGLGRINTYAGLTTMIETGTNNDAATTRRILNLGIRSMCLTALNPSAENNRNWTALQRAGYTAIMTDTPVQLREFITKK